MAIIRVKLHTAIKLYLAEDPGMIRGAESTRRGYARSLDVLRLVTSPQLGAYELRDEHIDQWVLALRKGGTPEENARRIRCGWGARRGRGDAALNADISAIKALIRFMHRREYLSTSRNPALHLKRVTGHTRQPIEKMVVQPDEVIFNTLLDHAGRRHRRDRVVMALGLYAGLRESEHLALRVEGVDFEAGEIRVWRKKKQEWHRVPMHHTLEVELRDWFTWLEKEHGELDPQWFVVGSRTNKPVWCAGESTALNGALTVDTPVDPTRPAWGVARDLKAAFKAAGYPDLYRTGAHTLRRMAAIHLTNETGDRRYAKTLLGHRDERTTELYLQHNDDTARLRRAMRKLRPETAPDHSNVVALAPRRRVA